MKKDTVSGWITRQRDLITRKEHNEGRRKAKLTALQQCEYWLFSLTWAQMRAPVLKKREDIAARGLPLLKKQEHDPTSLTEADVTQLNALFASDEVYELFENKVTPTARRAISEVKVREHERKQQAGSRSRQRGKAR